MILLAVFSYLHCTLVKDPRYPSPNWLPGRNPALSLLLLYSLAKVIQTNPKTLLVASLHEELSCAPRCSAMECSTMQHRWRAEAVRLYCAAQHCSPALLCCCILALR